MRWFVNRPLDNGGLYYRQTLPLRHLMPRLRDAGVRVTYSKTIDMSVDYDGYFFSRWVKADYLPLLIEIKRRGKLLIWDLDDDLFGLDRLDGRLHEKRAMLVRTLELCLDMADIITVSTDALGERTRRSEKTIVVPNLIDLDDNPPGLRDGNRDTLLFAGSASHHWDIELVRDLHRQTQRHFRWVWYGIRPDWLTTRDTWIPWARVSDYPKVCRLIRPLVSLAPLIADQFNLSKSPIKIWETATLGASVIASDYGPYAGSAAAICGPGEFFTRGHLDQVLDRPNHLACLAEARANSWQHGEGGRAKWLAAYERVLSLCSGHNRDHANQLPGSAAA